MQQLGALYAMNEGQQWLFGERHGIDGPLFFVYGLPLPDNVPLVTVRYPGGGDIDSAYRDPRYGWIDAMARLDGKTNLIFTYNFSTDVLPLDARQHVWLLLFNWLKVAGCPVQAIEDDDAEAAPAMIDGEESTAPKRRGRSRETDQNARTAKSLYEEGGLSQTAIAERFGVTVKTVQRWLKRAKQLDKKPEA